MKAVGPVLMDKFPYFHDGKYLKLKSYKGHRFVFSRPEVTSKKIIVCAFSDNIIYSDVFHNIDVGILKALVLQNRKWIGYSPAIDIMNTFVDFGRKVTEKGIIITDSWFSDDILWHFTDVGWKGLFIFINPIFNVKKLRDVVDPNLNVGDLNRGKILVDHDFNRMKFANVIIYHTSTEKNYAAEFEKHFTGNLKLVFIDSVPSLLQNIESDIKAYYGKSK